MYAMLSRFRVGYRTLSRGAIGRLPCPAASVLPSAHHHKPAHTHHAQQRLSSSTSGVTRIGTDDPRMSKIVVHNGTVYISGQTDATADDIEGQTRNVLAKVDDLLGQAGTSKSNLIAASIWLKDISRDFKKMNEVWNGWVDPDNKPVRATVESAMARPQLLIEVQVTAATK